MESALLASAALIVQRVISINEARRAVNLNVVFTIAMSISLGTAVAVSGLADEIGSLLGDLGDPFGDTGRVVAVLVATMILTELLSNNAAAAVMIPVATVAALEGGIDPRAMALVVLVGASCSFLFPIGYQTNLMVYGLGGYRFTDFTRLGFPLTIATIIVTPIALPLADPAPLTGWRSERYGHGRCPRSPSTNSGRTRVLAERMATQRLTSAPMERAIDVVRLLTGVQCQDAPLARYSIGLRTGLTDQAIRAELDTGSIVRTHVLRPTWHFVAAEDLRWLLALTSAKVESAMAARHRQLELTSTATDRAHTLLVSELADRRWMTRPELGARFAEAGLPSSGEQTGHLLMLAELRALICSGPLRGTTHTYGLVDDVARHPHRPSTDRMRRARLRGGSSSATVRRARTTCADGRR